MSLDEAEDVPDAWSFFSIRTVHRRRPAASRAIPVPLIPPPTIARSKSATGPPMPGNIERAVRSCLECKIGDDTAREYYAWTFAVVMSLLPVARARSAPRSYRG